MIDKITPEFLENIGIFELREIGREIGVYSPTTLKRDELSQKILDIYQGKAKPTAKNNRGRPVKTTGNAKAIVSSVKNQAELNYEFNETDKSMLILREPLTTFEAIAIEENLQCAGVLDISKDGYGIIKIKNYSSGELDVYLSHSQISAFNLKSGDLVQGIVNKNPEKKINTVHTVLAVNDIITDKLPPRRNFENLTPVYPNSKIVSFQKDNPLDINVLSLIAPLGKGQRAAVFTQDKFKKIDLIKNLGNAIKNNNEDIQIITLLLGEFPEEITEIKRAVLGEIVYTTFDEQPDNNIKVAELVLERAKRLAELGKDVVLIINNFNTLARAYSFKEFKDNNAEQQSYYSIRRFFGAARNIEEGGSLSIIAFVNCNTEIAFDDALCKELKGMGNSEIYLTKDNNELLIDIINSCTARKELLLNEEELECGKIIKKRFQSSSDSIKQIIPIIKNSGSVTELKENLKDK